MTVRLPAVAGQFYEGNPENLREQLSDCFMTNEPRHERRHFIGGVVPHAGLMYSGHVAAAFYGVAELPRRFVILCPNHTGLGLPAAINGDGVWRTPLGDAMVDNELAHAIMRKTSLVREDAQAHRREHSLEVQLPFLQQRLGIGFSFVPLCLSVDRYEHCEEIGMAIADVISDSGDAIGILASSDLNHYEDQTTTLRKDQLAIDQVLTLSPRELWRVVHESGISMCGVIPTTTMLIAALRLGATKAELLKHATSGDINHDYARVVGYASVLIS